MSFSIDRLSLRYALRLAITCTIVVAIYQIFQLHNGYWAAFSVLGCIFPTSGQSFRRIKQRIAGTFFGMILGIFVAIAAGNHWLYLDILIPLFVFFTVYLKAFNYVFYALFNTIISVALVCLIAPGNWHIALTRMQMTLLGCALALLASYLILPSRASDTLSERIREVRKALRNYYQSIIRDSVDPASKAILFEGLQRARVGLKEASDEAWWFHFDIEPALNEYQALDQVYQELLLLELGFPKDIENQQLNEIKLHLQHILTDIDALFDGDTRNAGILPALKVLSEKNAVLRAAGARDLSIPAATFREHIRLAETLNRLTCLSALLLDDKHPR
ncbi:FUSC family protein [Dyella sp. M7H15-1]|uniref:FUSC family protein n=1 Tax=Dyella sp. M7H15-1 TaxID=2501295 RepID=UPI001004EC29|nr:FUSC family protein [Dyella sp. M7H15-1]QAU22795.1 FUSC family protein [Dyella sp. M7H15-1]